MAEWQYNEPGITYNKTGLQYNFRNAVVAIKKYYTGLFHTTKAIFRRGIGF